MELGETLYVATREEWREWLARHWTTAPEIWLVSYRKETGKPGVAYADAVKEALCFGWIDSTRKTVDERRYAQRFSPRRPGSGYSQINRERLARLIEAGRVHPSVLGAAYVDTARDRGEEFGRRLETLVRRTAAGRQVGHGIEEFY